MAILTIWKQNMQILFARNPPMATFIITGGTMQKKLQKNPPNCNQCAA